MRAGEFRPARYALFLDGAVHQLVTKPDRGILACALVLKPDEMPFLVVHQRQIDRAREGALREFQRRAYVEQRRLAKKDCAVVLAIRAHVELPAGMSSSTQSVAGGAASVTLNSRNSSRRKT